MAAPFGVPHFDLADIVRTHRAALESTLNQAQRRVLTDIAQCRTAALGGHLDVCTHCGYEHPSYNSCRNRHCPKCQALAQQRWIDSQRRRVLDVAHFHVVFTLPAELRPLARFAPKTVYSLLFKVAAATLQGFAHRRLHAQLGLILVLHTWTKDMRFHPHVHIIATGGGLRKDGTWAAGDPRFLFPVKALARVFRAKMGEALARAERENAFAHFADFADPQGFERLMQKTRQHAWYVYTKRSFDCAKHVLGYLGRYTHRVALSNSRILAVSPDIVVLRTRGKERVSLTPVEMLRRFVLHVLPKGFRKIRYGGFYAHNKGLIRAWDAVHHSPPPPKMPAADYRVQLLELTQQDLRSCPRCGQALTSRPLPKARAPPAQASP